MKKKIQQMYRASLLMTLLLFSVVTVWAQATIPFGCSSKGYQVMIVSGSNPVTYSFDSYDIKTGIQSQLFNFPAGVSVNALGYNPTDNYMYTYKGGNQLYKIGADGYTAMTIAGLPATNPDPTAPTIPATGYNMADITDDGYMLLANSSSNRYYYVDLNPARPATYGKLVDPDTGAASTAFNTFTGGGTTLAVQYAGDVAYNKADGMFYTVVTYTAVSPNTYQLRKIDPVSGAVTAIGAVTGTPSNSTGNGYGSLFFDATGTLYGFFNPAGRYYSIPITGTGSRAATQVGGSYNPNSTNDGAMCPNTVLNYVNISGKVNNLNTGSGTNLGGQLYATLVDANGKVVDQVPVNADGTYTLAGSPNASYQVVITTTPATKGAAAPAPNLPPDWKNVRDGVGAANDGSANGSLSITTGTGDFSNANFDIQQMTVNPDFNSGYVNQTIKGNLNTNDKVPGTVGTTTTYGSPAVVGTNPSSDMPTINPDGTYTFTGTKPGVYTFDVPVCAGSVCVNNRLTITVAEPNSATNPPVANPDLATMTGYPVGGTPTSVTLNTLANDQPGSLSPALNPASVTPTQPAHGTVTKDALGNITYTPDPGFVGKDTIPYQVCDLSVPTPKCTSSYQVVTVNAPGTANSTSASDDYATAVQGASIVRTAATGLKANDVDPEGNATTITGIGGTALSGGTATVDVKSPDGTVVGSLTVTSNGSYTYTPTVASYTGPLNVPYTVTDAGGATASATLYLLITPDRVLPAVFGPIQAYWKDGVLYVIWNTLTEENCKEYTVEGSMDGKNWKALGTVLSKAKGGTSTTPLDYEFSTGAGALAVAGMGLAALLLLPAVRGRSSRWLLAVAAVLTIAACSKKMTEEIAAGEKPAYIRIAQKDINGTVSYSKVIKVEKE